MFDINVNLFPVTFSPSFIKSKQSKDVKRSEIKYQAENGDIQMNDDVLSETKTTSIKIGNGGSIKISGNSSITQRG